MQQGDYIDDKLKPRYRAREAYNRILGEKTTRNGKNRNAQDRDDGSHPRNDRSSTLSSFCVD
jgi:hypothetical protein